MQPLCDRSPYSDKECKKIRYRLPSYGNVGENLIMKAKKEKKKQKSCRKCGSHAQRKNVEDQQYRRWIQKKPNTLQRKRKESNDTKKYGKKNDEYLNWMRWIWKKMHMSNDVIVRLTFSLQFTIRWDEEFAKLARKHRLSRFFYSPI